MHIDYIWLKMVSINLNIAILSCVLSLSRTMMTNIVNDSMSKLLVISFDGFRPDFFNRNLTPTMNRIRKRGVSADYMRPVFPTKTLTNHFSIATGVYAGVHGVSAKQIYDNKVQRKIQYGYEMYHYNERLRPIWTLNEHSGNHSGCMMWSGANYPYQNTTCTFSQEYNTTMPWTERVDQVFSWFNHPETPTNLVMMYIEHPDKLEHIYSPDADEVNQIIAKLDKLVDYIQVKLDVDNMRDKLNIIYLSDHGMASLSIENLINLTQWIDPKAFAMYGTSPLLQIVPVVGREREVMENLTIAAKQNGHFRVYDAETLPRRWHYENDQRTGPITVVADVEYAFQDRYKVAQKYEAAFNVAISNDHRYGIHGYDNSEPLMRAIFFAEGPKFKTEHTVAPFNNVDLYNVFCLILDIVPDSNNGTRANINDLMVMFGDVENKRSIWNWLIVVGIVLASSLIIASIAITVFRFKKQKRYYFYENGSTLHIIPLQ